MVAGAETLVEKRPENPNQNDNRNPQRSYSCKKDDGKEHPIPARVGAGLLLLSHQQAVVTSIRLPKDMEDIARYRYCSYSGFQQHVSNHAHQSDRFGATAPGREH